MPALWRSLTSPFCEETYCPETAYHSSTKHHHHEGIVLDSNTYPYKVVALAHLMVLLDSEEFLTDSLKFLPTF
jgi:hypothetical protein